MEKSIAAFKTLFYLIGFHSIPWTLGLVFRFIPVTLAKFYVSLDLNNFYQYLVVLLRGIHQLLDVKHLHFSLKHIINPQQKTAALNIILTLYVKWIVLIITIPTL